jgi:vacuolar-type H+-ATPase subunit F/Vma7
VKIRLVGDAGDALALSLAGIESVVARNRREAERALAAAEAESGIGLLLVSASIDELRPRALERIRRRGGLPALVVLPAAAAGGFAP